MGPVQYLEIVVGLAVLGLIFTDLFQSVVLPRPSIYRIYGVGPNLLRQLWKVWRWLGWRRSDPGQRENFLAIFGPAGLLLLLTFWSVSLVIGYALIFDAIRSQIKPPLTDFWNSLYFSAGTILPLAYGDVLPDGGVARFLVLAESATGVIVVALVISLLFSLYQAFQAREVRVVSLDALAGAPPSGVHLLETAATYNMPNRLQKTFDDWAEWTAGVLESHLAYPVLFYFRSSHDNEAWLNSFGAVIDAAVLVLSTMDHDSAGQARLLYKVGTHLMEDTVWIFGLKASSEVGVEREEFEQARSGLMKVGYHCHNLEKSWEEFQSLRSVYASPLNLLVHRLAMPPAAWIGDRSYLPHASRPASRRRRRLRRSG